MRSPRENPLALLVGHRIAMIVASVAFAGATGAAPSSASLEFFESKVRPLLVENCYECHSVESEKVRGGLLLDSAWGWKRGGESKRPAIVPGDPDASPLIKAVRRNSKFEAMPPKSALPPSDIKILEEWIAAGAVDPRPKPEGKANIEEFDLEERKSWWSLQPLRKVKLPEPGDAEWARNSIDLFVRAGLEGQGMTPAPEAGRRAWIRRVTFDLTGLPPEPAGVAAFLADGSPDAHAKVVDRLLASPRFGEHWARHWMDLVRYAETKAFENDYTMPFVYRYRDYLIRSFNDDVPYNQFVYEAIAGDLIEQPRTDPETGINESVIGPGFFYLTDGHHGPPDIHEDQARVFDSMIDTVSKTFLGKTIACARCHDHKFDAITAADYYSMYGVLAGSRLDYANINPPARLDAAQAEIAAQKGKVRGELAALLARVVKGKKDAAMQAAGGAKVETFPAGVGGIRPGDLGGWHLSGRAFGKGPLPAGDFVPSHGGDGVVHTLAGGYLAAGALSSRFGGSVRSPDFTLNGESVRVRVKGKNARVSLYVRNYELVGKGPTTGGLTKVINSDGWQWVQFGTGLWKGETAYIEVSQNGGEFDFVTNGQHKPQHADGAYAVIAEAHLGGSGGPQATPVASPASVLRSLPAAWRAGKLSPEQAAVLEALFASKVFVPTVGGSPGLKREVERLRELQAAVPKPTYVRSMADGDPVDQPVFVRGSHKNISGEPNPRHFMDALDSSPFKGKGSGRRELAAKIASADNPLTARVMVNRVWHHMFGRGIVASTDDFGKMGDGPSHPELLDHLALGFMKSGWSVKKLIRAVALSSTYRMASEPSAESLEKDPKNLYLQHVPVRRLGAEAVRDTILWVSGELDIAMYGPGVPVNLHETNASRSRPRQSGPIDGGRRRSVYLELRRNYLPGLLVAFDMPNASQTFGRRNVTNVPAQSLAMLNDPFVHGQAEAWAKRVIANGAKGFEGQVETMHQRAFGRPAAPPELEWARGLFAELAEAHGVAAADAAGHLGVWTDFCHTMLNRKELIYVY